MVSQSTRRHFEQSNVTDIFPGAARRTMSRRQRFFFSSLKTATSTSGETDDNCVSQTLNVTKEHSWKSSGFESNLKLNEVNNQDLVYCALVAEDRLFFPASPARSLARPSARLSGAVCSVHQHLLLLWLDSQSACPSVHEITVIVFGRPGRAGTGQVGPDRQQIIQSVWPARY